MNESIAHDVSALDWREIAARLADPFDPAEVDFRPQGKVSPNANVQLLAYIDARTVQDRLDSVLGIQNWQYDWTPVGIDSKGEIVSVKATLTIHGISKSDVGVASNFEGDKGAVSGGLKRAAVQWGIGRYLYSLPASWQKADANGHIPPAVISQLRHNLPLPKGYTKPELRPLPMKANHPTYTERPQIHTEPEQAIPTVVQSTNTRHTELQHRISEIEAAEWEKLDGYRRDLDVTDEDYAKAKKTYTTVAEMAAALQRLAERKRVEEAEQEPVDEPQAQAEPVDEVAWAKLQRRSLAAKTHHNKAEWEALLERFGGSYEDILDMVERTEAQKGRH